VVRKWKSGDLTKQEERDYKAHFLSEGHKALLSARPALIGFLECLQRFFLYHHHQDAKRRAARDYLRRHFADLSDREVVLTPNWETTTERTLAEDGAWNPLTGDGFQKDLRRMPDGKPMPGDLPSSSKVTVLKLHGSIGWHPLDNGRIYFDHPQ